jgi:[acyl-carrier-protein] S-malonyltransferase
MNLASTALIFPGQGSQSVKMGYDLSQAFSSALAVFKEADDILGFPISKMMWEGPEESLNDTINTQPALLIHSAAALKIFRELYSDEMPPFVAGHSMGELSALLGADALSFRNALLLAQTRGRLMKQAGNTSPGGMAAILGLEIPTLEEICSKASTPGNIVQVANDNCPGQVVISGANAALEKAIELSQDAGARRAVRLAVSIAAHSPLMSMAQAEFNIAVEQAGLAEPEVPLVGNVTAKPLYTSTDIKADLQGQLTNRVRWTESIQFMIRHGVNTFIEVGSGSVLAGLVKRIDRQVACFSLGTPSDFDKLV